MYTYNLFNRRFNKESKWIPFGRIRGILCTQETYCTGQGGSSCSCPLILDGSQDEQAREAGPCYRRPRVSNYSSEAIRLESTKIRWIRWFLWWPGVRLGQLPGSCSRAVFSQAKTKGQSPPRSYGSRDSQMGGWTGCLVAKDAQVTELENNSKQPRDLTEKRQSENRKQEHAYSF